MGNVAARQCLAAARFPEKRHEQLGERFGLHPQPRVLGGVNFRLDSDRGLERLSCMSKPHESTMNVRTLLLRLHAGDQEAAAVMVAQLEPLVSRMVFRLTGWHCETEDLVHDVFLAIQQAAPAFRGESSLETWATAITIHQCRHWQRTQRKRRNHVEQVRPDNSYQPAHFRNEVQEEVQLALHSLSADLRELVVLRYLEEMSLAEITKTLGIRKNTLEVRLHRARKHLAEFLEARAIHLRE